MTSRGDLRSAFIPWLCVVGLLFIFGGFTSPVAGSPTEPVGGVNDGEKEVGRVVEFADLLDNDIPEHVRTNPERIHLPVRPLGIFLDSERLTNVILNYQDQGRAYTRLGCHGPPCPSFGICRASGYPNIEACWNPNLVDVDTSVPAPPLNCPRREERDPSEGKAWDSRMDERCTHSHDFLAHTAVSLQVFRMRDVFVLNGGYVANATHHMLRHGCSMFPKFAYLPGKAVHHVDSVFNWGYAHGSNFYHFIAEGLPSMFVAAALMPRLKSMAILGKRFQWDTYPRLGEPIIGLKRESIRFLPTVSGDVFFAKTVYQPLLQTCASPSKSLWSSLRRHHLLHPRGLPLFNPEWSYRHLPPLSDAQMEAFPTDWVVVVGRREGTKRAIANFNDLLALVCKTFEASRVVVYAGNQTLLEARDLMRRTRLFIAGHGALLTNMVFMPSQASVLEIRPNRCPSTCLNKLAYACSIKYHLVFSQGSCKSLVHANMDTVAAALNGIAVRFQQEDGREKQMPSTVLKIEESGVLD